VVTRRVIRSGAVEFCEWAAPLVQSLYHPTQPHATAATVASVAIRCIHRGYGAAMDDRHVQKLIDRAIREHELRVALWSGLLGLLLMAGTWHAIWLCR
jgi:hypothetical protein